MSESGVWQSYLERYDQLIKEKNLRPGRDTLTNEFQQIKRDSEKLLLEGQTVATAGAKEFNRRKNRYKDILPFDHSRVILNGNGTEEGSDYINASYIKSPDGKKGYIASQGPMPSTVDSFWWMIWQHKITVVVMACKEIEMGKHRCQRYWPTNGEEMRFGPISVTLVKEELVANCLTERKLKAVVGGEELRLSQLHYTAWPDHGVPKTTTDLIQIIETMREIHPWDRPPALLHCSAGCGRTGVMIAVDYGRRLIRRSPSTFNIYDLVMTLRKQRPAMVQSKEQYEYLHEVFRDLILEQTKKKEDSFSSYVNIDYPKKSEEEEIPFYENLDPKARYGDANSNARGFVLQKRLEESRKPVITTNIMNPQKAIIKTDLRNNSNKPVPLPGKKPALGSQSPLKIPKPVPNPTHTTPDVKLHSGVSHAQQNYINMEIGPPKIPSKPVQVENVPKVPLNPVQVENVPKVPLKPVHVENVPKVPLKPVQVENVPKNSSNPVQIEAVQKMHLRNSNNDPNRTEEHNDLNLMSKLLSPTKSPPIHALKPSSPPKLPIKAKPINFSPNTPENAISFEFIGGKRPPLPLKQKDLAEFDSLAPSNINDKKQRRSDLPKEMLPLKDEEPLFGGMKSRTLGRENGGNRGHGLNLWDHFPPDYDTGRATSDSASTKQVVPMQKHALLDDKAVNDHRTERLPTKDLLASDIFAPFEPSSSERVSPVPQEAAKEKAPELKKTAEKTALTDEKKSQLQVRDGLVRRTNASIVKRGEKRDGLVDHTNYFVSIEKLAPRGRSEPPSPHANALPKRPLLPKAEPVGAIRPGRLGGDAASKPRRLLSENNEFEKKERQHGSSSRSETNGVADESMYSKAVVNPRVKSEQAVYESIWSPSKQAPSEELPPELPPRTLDSLILTGRIAADENHCLEEEGAKEVEEASPKESESTASGEQGGIPWLSAGMDRLIKIAHIKEVFASKAPSRQTLAGSNSQFYAEAAHPGPPIKEYQKPTTSSSTNFEMTFGHRLPHKPKGPRPMPTKWQST